MFLFENSYNLFSCGVKYLNFGQKLPIPIDHHTFLESRHSELTKNLYYFFFVLQEEPKKGISLSYYNFLSS